MSLSINNSTYNTSNSYLTGILNNNSSVISKNAVKETDKSLKANQSTNNKDVAATYEGSNKLESKGTYSIAEMNQADRKSIAERLMQDFETKKGTMSSIVQQLFAGQGNASNLASLFSPENLANVSQAEIDQAKEDISEDGYFGIKQTSQRLFDFAQALAGDDPDKMKEMEEAMEKGFKKAEKAWGTALPEISQKTMDAARQLFADYYQSKKEIVTE